jgi:hypothetical protein
MVTVRAAEIIFIFDLKKAYTGSRGFKISKQKLVSPLNVIVKASSIKYFLVLQVGLISLLLSGCAKVIPDKGFPKEIIPDGRQYNFDVSQDSIGIQALYLGCGHLVIQYKNEVVVFDPFFSTSGLLVGSVKTDQDAFNKYKNLLAEHHLNLKNTKSVWLAHTHYDHLMDLPKLMQEEIIPKAAPIYGSNFGDSILTNFLNDRTYHSLLRNETFEPGRPAIPAFILASPSIRIMPIQSNHAAHFKLLGIPIHMMKGNLKKGYFKRRFKDDDGTTKRKRWKEGCTYSFLVDFMEGNEIKYRLFIQTSASQYPLGKPPESLIKERGVDVAFLCVASFNKVRDYPIKILTDLQPKKIAWIHWEDFFGKPLEFESARLVRLTNFNVLGKRLKKSTFKPTPENQLMPRPGTLINIR